MRTAAHVAKSGRSPRRVYSRPASDYQSSVAICVRRIVADGTAEGGLIGPVLFCDVSTSVHSREVSRGSTNTSNTPAKAAL